MPKKAIEIIGVASDLGANIAGTSLGPQALRLLGLKNKLTALGLEVFDQGDIKAAEARFSNTNAKNLLPVLELCHEVMNKVSSSLSAGHLPLILGGDHSIAIGSVSATAAYYKAQNQNIGIIWVDAHADSNTPESSPTGNIHGMALASILGNGHESLVGIGPYRQRVLPQNVALIGIRLIDELEKELLRSSGIHYFSMHDIDQKGMTWVMDQALKYASHNTSAVHLSFDLDSLDAACAPGVSTPVPGGLSTREARYLCERVAKSGMLSSLDFVELNPLLDQKGQTVELCLELIQSALGMTII